MLAMRPVLWKTLANAVTAAISPVMATISAVTVCGSDHIARKKTLSGIVCWLS